MELAVRVSVIAGRVRGRAMFSGSGLQVLRRALVGFSEDSGALNVFTTLHLILPCGKF